MIRQSLARLAAATLGVGLLASGAAVSTADAQYGSYRGSKYSGGFGGTGFTSRRAARHTNIYAPGLFNPLSYGVPLGFGGVGFGGFGYGGLGYGGLGYGGLGYGGLGHGGLGFGGLPYYTAPGYSPYAYSPYDYQRYGVRTVGVSPGAVYQPGFAAGFTSTRRLGLGGGFASLGAYGYGYNPYPYGVGATPVGGFVDPYALPQAPVNPTTSYYTDDADTARRLRQMLRDGETAGLDASAHSYRAARPLSLDEVQSSPADKAKSVRLEERGDRHFAAQDYLKAYTAYADAVDAAGDRTEPRAKLVLAYAAIGQYDRAVGALKTLLTLDPNYPRHFQSLDAMFGDNRLGKEATKTRVAEWTAGHVSDPDRLLLLGAVMYFDGDIDRARGLLASAQEFDGGRLAIAPLLRGEIGRAHV